MQQGEFREDLFYRINVIPIQSPSLLVNLFIGYLSKRNGFSNKLIDPKCYSILSQYSWLGGVRELLKTIDCMLIIGDYKLLVLDIPDEISNTKSTFDIVNDELNLKEFRYNMERELLIKKLKQYKGNITHVSKSLMIERSYLYKKLTQYNIKRNQNFD